MPDTFVKIASVTVGSGGASSIDFTSIPSTYTDLVVKVSARTTRSVGSFDNLYLRYNGSSTAVYNDRYLYGDGSTVASYSDTNVTSMLVGVLNQTTQTANTFSSVDIYIPNYAGSINKSLSSDSVTENNATASIAVLNAGLWANTSAISSIGLTCLTTFAQYSTATLYGISNS